jgi:enediyne biosynthesis protein E8
MFVFETPHAKKDLRRPAVPESQDDAERVKTLTLEAFADTIVPGEKRSPDDRAIAGVTTGGGAVVCGALELLHEPAAGIAAGLPFMAPMLNDHAQAYAAEHGLELDDDVPAFVALPYEHRAALIQTLTAPGHPEREGWVLVALFSNMAFDLAPHKNTAEALAEGHPGLTAMGFAKPDTDGLWRFKDFSYGRALANLHPDTIASGSLG